MKTIGFILVMNFFMGAAFANELDKNVYSNLKVQEFFCGTSAALSSCKFKISGPVMCFHTSVITKSDNEEKTTHAYDCNILGGDPDQQQKFCLNEFWKNLDVKEEQFNGKTVKHVSGVLNGQSLLITSEDNGYELKITSGGFASTDFAKVNSSKKGCDHRMMLPGHDEYAKTFFSDKGGVPEKFQYALSAAAVPEEILKSAAPGAGQPKEAPVAK